MNTQKQPYIPPSALTIAGSDSGGGAGAQADLKTMSALGVFATTVLTSVTAQNTCHVTAVHPLPAELVRQQFDTVTEDISIHAVKAGLLASPELIRTVARCLEQLDSNIPFILDPVMVAKNGSLLTDRLTMAALKEELIPAATLITPNLTEAAILTGQRRPENSQEMEALLPALLDLGAGAVLLKGGFLSSSHQAIDYFCSHSQCQPLYSDRVETTNLHGSGCTLSAAVTAFMARGMALAEAVTAAKDYVSKAIEAGSRMQIGHGNGPLRHFF